MVYVSLMVYQKGNLKESLMVYGSLMDSSKEISSLKG
jgi:hypothetical protein